LADPALGSHALIDAGTLAAVATPIELGGQVTGVLALDQVGEPRAWTSQEIRLLESVARELRTALEAAQLLLARQRENQRMLALHRASTLIAAETEPTEVLREILDAAASLIGRGSASLYRWDEHAGLLRLAESVRAERDIAPPLLRAGEGVCGQAFLTLKPVIVNDYQGWEHAVRSSRAAGQRAALAVPLIRAGHGLGALAVRSTHAVARFDDDDARLLSLFADQAVAALTTVELLDQQRRAVEELERLNSAKSNFVSIVSHEFRTPLTGIQGFSELIRDENLTREEMKEYAGDINKDAQRLNRMITEMLDLDRMESGRMTLNRERADVNAIVAEAAQRLASNAARHPILLNLDPELPLIEIDKDKINQVLLNLLSNAVKYSPEGGEIAVSTRVEGQMVHVFVRDSGMGIPADSLEKVFERFSRLESGATRYIQGTGLGLPISRQIIEMHGGRAWVESTLGEGSVFQFTLPLVAVASV
jgi:signal transduction histidine kinase